MTGPRLRRSHRHRRYRFVDLVVACHSLPLGNGFDTKLQWLARTLTLTWLGEAATHDPAHISKHLRWVAHAFTPRPLCNR